MLATGLFSALTVLALGAAPVGVPLGTPPLPPDATIQRAVPEECLALFYSAGIGEPDPKSANQTEQLLAESEVQEFLGKLQEQIAKGIDQARQRGLIASPAAKYGLPLVATLLRRPWAAYVSHWEPQPAASPDVRAALIVNCGSEAAATKTLLAAMVGEAVAANSAPIEKTFDGRIAGADMQIFTLKNQAELGWGFRGEYCVLTFGKGAAQELLDRTSTEGKPAPWFVALQKQTQVERLSTLGYLNAARLWEIGLPQIRDAHAKKILETLGLTHVKSAYSAGGLNQQGMVSRAEILFDGSPQGLFELLAAKPLAAADLQGIPQNASMGGAARLDLATVYRRGLELAAQVEPQAVEEFRHHVATTEQSLGFELENGLLASLGDVWTIHGAPEGGLPGSNLVATVTVRDQAKLTAIHDRLLGILKLQEGRQDGPPFSIQETAIKEQKVYQLVFKTPVPFSPVWCLREDRLVVAASLQTLKSHFARPKSPNLADVPEIAARFNDPAPPATLLYQDVKASLPTLYAMVQIYSPIAVGALAAQGIQVELPALPNLSAVTPHITPVVAIGRRSQDGLLFERTQSAPLVSGTDGATTGVLVALLLPAVQAAREAARRNQATNELKQIALALLNYHDVYRKFPARAITDKEGKPLLSWRVAILPYLEEVELYNQFHLDEPWDSPHNRTLIAQMPEVYTDPSLGDLNGKTVFQAPAVKDAALAEKRAAAESPKFEMARARRS